MPAMTCPKCGSPMTSGFLLDMKDSATVTDWVEGAPEKSFWTGLNLKGRRRFPVVADRCERCGFLELYA
ncbi:MAG: PF20097 family protein [Longimicrobiaceae bacterium]